jgi:hypothetical protein
MKRPPRASSVTWGLADRVERKVLDFVEAGTEVEAADIVLMNRVICCYPDMPRLAGAAADRTRGFLMMSSPRGCGGVVWFWPPRTSDSCVVLLPAVYAT